ncbi:COG1361 S-layer family protein [Methanothrix sp.]|uniref:COG1361 S-layer family protein n=1 Tax=Methanothrix sp. TaxID=90426 RepID=UPI003C741EAD
MISVLLACSYTSTAIETGAPVPPEMFGDDYYKVYGVPDLTVSLERSSVYQGEKTSIFLTLTNRGRITAIKVNSEPAPDRKDEILAAQRELELERQRTTAQDVSVELFAENRSAIDVKRAVAFPGNIREGQTSAPLEFPIEVYKNTYPGMYRMYALINCTYQRDVAVKSDEDRPESPDVYYWYDRISQVVPLELRVERKSGVEFDVLGVDPERLPAGSSDNVVRISIKNVGTDTARDLVARLRPESGIYVSVDESPVPRLEPGESAEFVYKLDVSKDAVPGKLYLLRILFEFSDTYRDNLSDSGNVYIMIDHWRRISLWAAALLIAAIASIIFIIRKRRGGA